MNRLRRKLVKAFIDEIVLAQLGCKPSLSGYEIMAFVHKRYDVLVSSGTIYPTLYRLEREGYVQSSFGLRKRNYTLTEQGKQQIETIQNHKAEIEKILTDIFIQP